MDDQKKFTVIPVVLSYMLAAFFVIKWFIGYFQNPSNYPMNSIGIVTISFFSLSLVMPFISFLILKYRAKIELRTNLGFSSFFGLTILGALIASVLLISFI